MLAENKGIKDISELTSKRVKDILVYFPVPEGKNDGYKSVQNLFQ